MKESTSPEQTDGSEGKIPFLFPDPDYTLDFKLMRPKDAPPLTIDEIEERLKEMVVEHLKADTPKFASQR
ncbi:MAG: hypothetical protein IJI57_04535 [Flexilinea sp.]|nr:hypothetical protein [Flexilinea sp.]